MRLHRLELFGFKSFYNRTVFQFDEGVTSIVGPNGCGKSNIVDAMVWALGERGTKTLRVKDMGDVIFHGSNGKRPVNIAEVTIDLTDGGKDVSVRRRVYRDGTSEYFLNGESVRLKDVQDFFLGTGVGVNSYAIVEQGRIEYLIQMKPQERRIVIEETSGITRFEEKKRDAIARLAEVSSNLERVEDIYSEVKASFEKAEIEWNRWKIYKELADKQSEIDKWILLDGFMKVKKRIGKISERHEEIDREIALKEAERVKLREELDAKEDEFSLVDTTSRKLEVDIKGKEKDMENRLLEIEYLKGEFARLEEDRKSLEKSMAVLDETSSTYQKDIESLEASRVKSEALLLEEENQVRRFQEALEKQKKNVEEHEAKIEAERGELFVAMSKLTETKNRIAEIERQVLERKKREAKRVEERARLNGRLAQLQSSRSALQGSMNTSKAEREKVAGEEAVAISEREKINQLINTERIAIESSRSEKRAKEAFLKQMASLKSDGGKLIPDTKRLIDLVRAEEVREKALERFFFRELEYHVLRGKDTEAIVNVVQKYEGNFIFFPKKGMFKQNSEEVELDVKWIENIHDGLKKIENGEEGIFINDDVFIDSRGLILREKEERKVDLKQFRERKKAEKALKEIEEDITKRLTAMKDHQDALGKRDMVCRNLKMQKDAIEKAIHNLEREFLLIDAENKLIGERLTELNSEIDLFEETPQASVESLLKEQNAYEDDRQKREGNMAALRQHLDKAKADYEDTRTRRQEAAISIERHRNTLKALDEDVRRKVVLIKTAQEDKGRIIEKIGKAIKAGEEVTGKTEGLEKDYNDIKETCEKDIQRYESLKVSAGNLHMEKQTLQERIDTIIKEMERTRNRKESGEKELAILSEKRDAIMERLASAYGIDAPESVPVPHGENFEDEREKIVAEISGLGEVNFRAEMEYLELKERIAFLEQQKEDLRNAMDSLKKTIAKIDSLSKDIFIETFEVVNSAYKKFVQLLFKGGQGYLAVSQDGSGIEIYAQPPGKKVARMEQLSGGEKALVSLGFLLALMDTKPSPFSLMDEIDAPLDDANLMGLMEIIKDISRKTQIIFITHNRITMECSNTIYGVTMEDEGVSKVVSVRL
jgi:chromosome segregation protein